MDENDSMSPFQASVSDIEICGFISRAPDEFLICANIPGREPFGYYYAEHIFQRASKLAVRAGVTLPDVADRWNARLRRRDEQRMRRSFSVTVTTEMGQEDIDALLRLFGG